METMAYMKIVPGSFRPYPCNCQQDTAGNHASDCPLFMPKAVSMPPYFGQEFIPQPTNPFNEQCGRCWQNHTPGFVCMCGCHINPVFGTTTTAPADYTDTGDDLDAPQNT